ncbi:MAG: 6-pyruvoyl tetrahydropterin synthase family protein [Promethearchaeota archaeon]
MPSQEQIFSQVKNSFSANHFLVGYGKCERLHGHNYSLTVKIKYKKQRFLDFRTVNDAIKHELQLLDQKILLPEESPEIRIQTVLKGRNWQVTVNNKMYSFPKQDVLILNGIEQITAENLAIYLHKRISTWLQKISPDLISILDIIITENLGNQAKYSAPINES